MFTTSFGAPYNRDPHENKKVALGVALVIGVTGIVYYGIRSLAKPPPRTMTPEWKEKERENLIKQNANPIFGISAKQREIDNLVKGREGSEEL